MIMVPAIFSVAWFVSMQTGADTNFEFSDRFTECINQWVAFAKKEDETRYLYGFIYVDPQAGFTMQLEGKFEIAPDGKLTDLDDEKTENSSLKIRLSKNNMAAILTPEQRNQLGLPDKPDWLAYYDDGSNSVYYRTRLGFYCNALDDPTRALSFLESAYAEDPEAEGLAFEMAYAYNALDQPQKAIPILTKAMEKDAKDVTLGSELAYCYLQSGQQAEAIKLYKHFLSICPEDHFRRVDMAINLSHAYQQTGDEKVAGEWMEKAKQWYQKNQEKQQTKQ